MATVHFNPCRGQDTYTYEPDYRTSPCYVLILINACLRQASGENTALVAIHFRSTIIIRSIYYTSILMHCVIRKRPLLSTSLRTSMSAVSFGATRILARRSLWQTCRKRQGDEVRVQFERRHERRVGKKETFMAYSSSLIVSRYNT